MNKWKPHLAGRAELGISFAGLVLVGTLWGLLDRVRAWRESLKERRRAFRWDSTMLALLVLPLMLLYGYGRAGRPIASN